MSVTVNNSPIQDQSFTLMITDAQPTAVVTPGFKPFTVPYYFDEIIPSNILNHVLNKVHKVHSTLNNYFN